jgi:hypothetical protein
LSLSRSSIDPQNPTTPIESLVITDFTALQRSQWIVSEPLIVSGVDELPVVPRKVVDRFRIRGFVEGDRGLIGCGGRESITAFVDSPPVIDSRQVTDDSCT